MDIADEHHLILALSLAEEVGPTRLNTFLAALDAYGYTLKTYIDHSQRNSIPIAPHPSVEKAIKNLSSLVKEAKRITRNLRDRNSSFVTIKDLSYSIRLKRSLGNAAPPVLFYQGDLSILERTSIAMIGTRAPSEEGRIETLKYAESLAREGVNIVSGNARGIDTAAHTGALLGEGATTFVLPNGIFRFKTAVEEYLLKHGTKLVVSQFLPHEGWKTGNAIIRNTTIVALADGVIVGETGLKGGTSYGIKAALEMGKPLWALNLIDTTERSRGNRSLISNGALSLPVNPRDIDTYTHQIIDTMKKHSPRKARIEQISFVPTNGFE